MEIKEEIIGRRVESEALDRLMKSKKSEFAIVYGRRRVGKTFLVSRTFAGQFAFRMTALAKGNLETQLQNFHFYLSQFDPKAQDKSIPKNWLEAFQQLISYLSKHQAKRKVVFFDELPWFDTHGSDFLTGLEHFWNGWASYRSDILLISCGSAASWMIKNLIRDSGGLHNRVTERIFIQPFTLQETEAFMKSNGADYDRYQLLELYMALGGIPFYLENIQVNRSVAQNIDRLFFTPGGLLHGEYFDLYRSLFKNYERHISIVEALAIKSKGLSRKEIVSKSGLKEGGNLSVVLDELEQSGFIKRHFPFGKSNRDSLYQLSDPYTLFYLSFVRNSKAQGEGTWLSRLGNPGWRAWSGYAFEQICRYHAHSLKKHLGISAVYTEVSTWRSKRSEGGAQIDLIFDRDDRVINLCEIKFSESAFSLTKAYAEKLNLKRSVFQEETKTRKTLFLTMITTFGLKPNSHSTRYIKDSLEMNALFD